MINADTQKLTHYLTDNLAITAKQFDRKATILNLAAKATLVAIFIIGAAALTVMLCGAEIFGASTLIVTLGCTLATPLLFKVERYFATHAQKFKSQATIEYAVDAQNRSIETWTLKDIQNFYREHLLQSLPDETLDRTRPLIARYLYWNQQFQENYREALKYLNDNVENSYLKDTTDRDIRYLLRQQGWNLLENNAIPARLQSAVSLQLLQNPYQEIELSDIGHHQPISFGQWSSEAYCDQKDPYFCFKNSQKPDLSSHQIVDLNNDLRNLVFG